MGFIANDVTLRALLERRAARDPQRACLVHGGRSLTFSELDAAVNRLANGLAARGIVGHVQYGDAEILVQKSPLFSIPCNFERFHSQRTIS